MHQLRFQLDSCDLVEIILVAHIVVRKLRSGPSLNSSSMLLLRSSVLKPKDGCSKLRWIACTVLGSIIGEVRMVMISGAYN